MLSGLMSLLKKRKRRKSNNFLKQHLEALSPMNETHLVNAINGTCEFGNVEKCEVLLKDALFD